jgi:hypothetical protein
MNLSRFEMQLPLSSSVVWSNMVDLLLAFVAPGAIMSISILLGYTSLSGCTLALGIFPSFVSFYVVACPSTYHCSTPSFLSDFWMHTKSTSVAQGLPYSFKLQPFHCLLKKSTTYVLTYICPQSWNVQIAFSHGIAFLPHIPKMTVNVVAISLLMVECLTF